MITMAEEMMIPEATVAEAYGLTQDVIYGLTYLTSRRLVGANHETQKEQMEEHRKEVEQCKAYRSNRA